MKISPTQPRARRASAMITVIVLTGIMAVLTASMLRYTLTERRGNERNRVILRAKNMSESISVYAAEQITTILYRLRSTTPIAFMTGANEIDLPPLNLLQVADASYTSGANMEVRAGLTGSTGLLFIDPATNPGNPNAGLQVNTASVPIIAKATARHTALGTIPAYSQHNLAVDFVPLFQFAVFYNMDMEIWPGADMTLAGPVHCNGELSARSATGFTANVSFLDRVSASMGFYANSIRQGTWINNTGGTDAGPGGNGPLRFQHTTTGVVTDIQSGASVWRDHKYGSATETTTTQNNFKVFATTSYGVNLRTSVHGVTPLVLPGISNYSKTNLPSTPEDDRNNGRQIIARPDATDTAGLKETKIARKAGLYIIVNPDNATRTGYKPDGTAVSMRARSYRCWLNTVNADLTHSIVEVILPGQPSYGDLNANVNNLPNRYTTSTSIGHNQVLRTIQGGGVDLASTGNAVGATPTMTSFSDAYFYDLRRAKNNSGAGSQLSTGSFRSSNPYTPRPIVKIDFDLTRFRMAVERTMSGTSLSYVATATTSTIYNPAAPNASNWGSSIYNPASSAAPAAYGLGMGASFNTFPTSTTLTAQDPYRIYFAPADPADPLITTNPGSFAVGPTDLASTIATKPWFDGVTVYIHSVDAEVRGDANADGLPDRIDSAVRLWNGRGRIVSLDGGTYPGMTGFTFATNDAAYIVGHFNADGTINATSSDNANPGGYSARYPDSASERLCSVMADAVTILSMPAYDTTYRQISGWSDSLSAHRTGSSGWSSSWATTQPSGSNSGDGINLSFVPAALPNLGNITPGSGSARTTKFGATATEISTALLVGIVPTNHNPVGLTDGPPSTSANGQASGGVHNFPRLLEVWSGAGLYIRGSMVAMFESRVAMEPWNLRIYSAPGRYWGLHQSLRSANHDLPLEPILLGARRLGFKEITAAEYATMKTTIEALPH
ncbi:MAG: hypothetical protein JNK23_19825 [Opitutaceae bacterium]|nr:hypothetical protein [Opitutaceae bacterium]